MIIKKNTIFCPVPKTKMVFRLRTHGRKKIYLIIQGDPERYRLSVFNCNSLSSSWMDLPPSAQKLRCLEKSESLDMGCELTAILRSQITIACPSCSGGVWGGNSLLSHAQCWVAAEKWPYDGHFLSPQEDNRINNWYLLDPSHWFFYLLRATTMEKAKWKSLFLPLPQLQQTYKWKRKLASGANKRSSISET